MTLKRHLLMGLALVMASASASVAQDATIGGAPSQPAAVQPPAATADPAAGTMVTEPAVVVAAMEPQPFLPESSRVPAPEIDAFLSSPDTALSLTSAGWVRQSRIVRLAGSDLRAVRALVDYARSTGGERPGIVSDIAAGLERASRDAERAGNPVYGQRIQQIVAEADYDPLGDAYAFAERSAGNMPETAAIGAAGAGATGAASAGALGGGNEGMTGGTGGAVGDDTVETRFGTYPVFSSNGSFDDDDDDDSRETIRYVVINGSGGGTDTSPAE